MTEKKAATKKVKKEAAPKVEKVVKTAEVQASGGPYLVVKKVTDLSRGTTTVTRETVAKL